MPVDNKPLQSQCWPTFVTSHGITKAGWVNSNWGWMIQISVNKLTINGSDSSLTPGRHQAIIWTSGGIMGGGGGGGGGLLANSDLLTQKLFIYSQTWHNCWRLGKVKLFQTTLFQACDYLSVLEFKLIHVYERGPRWLSVRWASCR